jgi:hypothetical protein
MLCLLVGALAVPLMSERLTLAWTHSVEKIPWEEDWVEAPGSGLRITATRVRGSGAGMEPAADARLVDGAWTWTPNVPVLKEVVLRRSGATEDWRVCIDGACRAMGSYVGRDADPVTLSACPAGLSGPAPPQPR